MEQEAEPWQSGAAGPCLTVDGPGGPVEPWVLGQQRFRVTAPSGEQVVEGFQNAREAAHPAAAADEALSGVRGGENDAVTTSEQRAA
jgi:hypothetical protein